jgi:hypothetical protein
MISLFLPPAPPLVKWHLPSTPKECSHPTKPAPIGFSLEMGAGQLVQGYWRQKAKSNGKNRKKIAGEHEMKQLYARDQRRGKLQFYR